MTAISNTAPPDLSCVVGSFLQSGVLPPVIADEARGAAARTETRRALRHDGRCRRLVTKM